MSDSDMAAPARKRLPMKAKLIGLLSGVALTPVALFFAAASAGAGHGDYVAARILYPFSILSTHLTGAITGLGMALAYGQFPLYGWLMGTAFQKHPHARRRLSFATLLVAIHAAAVAAVFAFPNGFAR